MNLDLRPQSQRNFDEMEKRWLDCPDDTESISEENVLYCDHCGCKGTSDEIKDYFTNVNGTEVYETLCKDCAIELGYTDDD